MHADLTTAITEHARATERWLGSVEAVSPQQAGWRPGPERWSLAQCLDHVTITTSPPRSAHGAPPGVTSLAAVATAALA